MLGMSDSWNRTVSVRTEGRRQTPGARILDDDGDASELRGETDAPAPSVPVGARQWTRRGSRRNVRPARRVDASASRPPSASMSGRPARPSDGFTAASQGTNHTHGIHDVYERVGGLHHRAVDVLRLPVDGQRATAVRRAGRRGRVSPLVHLVDRSRGRRQRKGENGEYRRPLELCMGGSNTVLLGISADHRLDTPSCFRDPSTTRCR